MEAIASSQKPFIEHVQELRLRLLVPALFLLIGGVVGYLLREPVQALLMKPLSQPLFYTSPAGGFEFVFKVSLFVGVLAAVPVLTYNLLKFLEPAMPSHVNYLIIKVLVASVSLAGLGAGFAYFVSLPAALHFLSEFGGADVHSLISTNEYLSFVTLYMAGFALLFQLPLILLFINRMTPLDPGRLLRRQRLVIVASFVLAAIVTPTPDPFNQLIMAGPMILLYEFSVALVWLTNRGRRTPASSSLAVIDGPSVAYTEGLLEELPDCPRPRQPQAARKRLAGHLAGVALSATPRLPSSATPPTNRRPVRAPARPKPHVLVLDMHTSDQDHEALSSKQVLDLRRATQT